ncbi:Serine/threonine-protein phosphatase 2A activator 1 [Trametes pubescens]|uniref:Serine/threonine-protein phosphatase 2A activator n=1 Tax=Trametes pubescens TaxID=154538 RepID=A0A1M2W5E3_TRAPU|nr:Serine/threonine-protein phosphatase 2A activator 1 [Trametes pubescens]
MPTHLTTARPSLREVPISSLDPSDTPVLRIKSEQDACTALGLLLNKLDKWIDEIPPLPTPQRFGNLAFRTWGKRLETECDALLRDLLPEAFHPSIPFISPYLLTSFGSFTRMDYGTGHETSFMLFLMCLTLLRFLPHQPPVERQIVLGVFVQYVKLCWRLQDVYKLEPAGSHGVWGLDDYSFLTYVFGSSQLQEETEIPVSAVLHPPLPPTNLYFMAITRILQVKSGPFHEHSSQLYAIATGVQHWSKVYNGMLKMYEGEVLGKRVVVQHIPLGGLLKWDPLPSTPAPSSFGTSGAPLPQRRLHNIGYRPNGPWQEFRPPRAPLRPTASTALRPTAYPAVVPNAFAPPPAPADTHIATEGDDQASRTSGES